MAEDGAGLSESPLLHGGFAVEAVRAQLDRILSHRDFEATDRTREFLRFVVEETLADRTHRLKGYTIAIEIFGRTKKFDANLDPIVRIQAGRLRRALEHYYLVAGGNDPLRIDIPKGRYVPTFTAWPPPSEPAAELASADIRTGSGEVGATVAVMPLVNVSEDLDQAFFVDGLVEELVGELNRYEGVICISCREVAGADGADVHQRDNGRTPGARFVLGGSVRRDRAQMKVAVQLTDALTGEQIWSEAYTISLEAAGLIATQEEIARDVVAAVADEYGAVARRLLGESLRKPPAELSTYDALLRYHHYMLVMTPEAAAAAFAALEAATAREPEYGPAWAALANLYCHALVFDRPEIEAPLDTAYAYARRGTALSPDSQLARTIMAYVYLLRGEVDLFRGEAETALAMNPNSPNFGGTLGYLHAMAGEFDRGCDLLTHAIAVNPHHPKWFHHALYACHFARRDYESAYREVLHAGHPPGFWDPTLRAAALAKLGRLDEARAAGRELLEVKPDAERRLRTILSHSYRHPEVVGDFIDALRAAGLHIEG